MTDEITLTDLQTFDFSAPLNVTVFYDDSDEDTKEFITILSGDDEPNNPQVQNVSEENATKDETKVDTNQPNHDTKNDISSPEKKRSRIEVDDKNNKNFIQNSIKDKTVQNTDTDKAVMPENYTDYQTSNTENNPRNEGNLEITLGNNDEDLMRKKFQQVRNYIDNLLNNVSEHLIMIVNAFQEHAKIVDDNKSRTDGQLRTQDSKERYNRFKYHIFHLSYSAVVSVILDQESSNEFVEEFLNRTVEISHSKSKFQYTSQYIQPFFYELINWAKQKKNFMTNIPATEMTKSKTANDSPLLVKQLSQPSLVPPRKLRKPAKKKNNQEKSNVQTYSHQSSALSNTASYQDQSTTIFRSGPPGREVSVSIQPNLLHIQNQQMAKITNTQQRSRQPPPPYSGTPNYCTPDNCYHLNQNQQGNHIVHNFAANSNVAPPVNLSISNQYINHAMNNPNRQYINQENSVITWNSQGLGMHQPSLPLPSVGLRPNETQSESRHYQNTNIQQGYRSYEQQYTPGDGNLPCLDDAQNLQHVSSKTVVENGRSVSTDSGFASPLQFNTGEKTPGVGVDSSQGPDFAPYITHVTSLNPNAVQIALGSCHVCRKPTKTKCMGCYEVYYCNTICENADWNNHIFFCKRSTET